jgi:hypothetical protein
MKAKRNCPKHHVALLEEVVRYCPSCRSERGLRGGKRKSKAKLKSSRANGRLGGRPKKNPETLPVPEPVTLQ